MISNSLINPVSVKKFKGGKNILWNIAIIIEDNDIAIISGLLYLCICFFFLCKMTLTPHPHQPISTNDKSLAFIAYWWWQCQRSDKDFTSHQISRSTAYHCMKAFSDNNPCPTDTLLKSLFKYVEICFSLKMTELIVFSAELSGFPAVFVSWKFSILKGSSCHSEQRVCLVSLPSEDVS